MINKIVKAIKSIILFSIIVGVTIALVLAFFVIIPIKGSSMLPTVEDADNVLVIKNVDIERGDVVIFEDADGSGRLIKRVIALEGDVVELKLNDQGNRAYYVNGIELQEDYVNDGVIALEQQISHKVTVPNNCFYYLGDNRKVSKDSSHLDRNGNPYYGKMANIIGKVVLRYNLNQWEIETV